MSRRRSLSDEERALWTGFVRSITPLQRSRQPAQPSVPSDAGEMASAARPPAPRDARPEKKTPPLAPLGRRLKQRVARGREPIEVRLDLHGFTQKEAHAELLRFLCRAQADGVKIALIVTGKGADKVSDAGERHAAAERGVLRRQVPMWLALPEFRPLVVGFEDAHAGHGGKGALYVRLRRLR
jgi:DNA-nicking Smr family endonuclease